MENNENACRICGNSGNNKVHSVREMMFGSRHVFRYLECAGCGCLQIIDKPQDMRMYYPSDYYSFRDPEAFRKAHRDNPVVRFFRHRRTAYMLGNTTAIGRFCLAVNPSPLKLATYIEHLRLCRASFDSRILDVGSGQGEIISELEWYGFRDLTGVDIFIDKEVHTPRVNIYKRDIFSMDGTFDIIMFNHSFEHMDTPVEVLTKARELVADNGCVLIRIPTVSSYAWEHYGADWVSLDAPRHIFLYSIKSIELLAARTGFTLRETLYDAAAFSLWGSEQNKADIAMNEERSYSVDKSKSIFTEEQIAGFSNLAEKLNAQKRGDAVCLFLEPVPGGRS